MFGGLGTDCETYVRVIMTLSQGHPAAGWCYTLASSHALILASCFSEGAQRELFGADGDFRAAYAAGPAGVPKFERKEGGYSHHRTVAFRLRHSGAAITFSAAPSFRMRPARCAPSCSSWRRTSVRPERLGRRCRDGHAGQRVEQRAPHRCVHSRSSHRPFADRASVHGESARWHARDPAARGGLVPRPHLWLVQLRVCRNPRRHGACRVWRVREATAHEAELCRSDAQRMEEPEFQRLYGEAMCRADAAEALALAATRLYIDQCRRWAQEGVPVRAEDSLQVWGISREGCRAACEAVEMLFHSIGASVVRRGERLQRYFRDVQMYRVHFQSQAFSPVLRSRVQLGLPIPPPFHR